MKIEKYSFGSILIDGKKYRKDVIIFPDHVFSPWWREQGHSLSENDLDKIYDYEPDILIIGTGARGVMDVPSSVRKKTEERGIKTYVMRTEEAASKFNKFMNEERKAVAALHLTC